MGHSISDCLSVGLGGGATGGGSVGDRGTTSLLQVDGMNEITALVCF